MASPAQPGSDDVDVVARLAQLAFLVQGTLARATEAHQLTTVPARLLMVLSDRRPELAGLLGSLSEAERRRLGTLFGSTTSTRTSSSPTGSRAASPAADGGPGRATLGRCPGSRPR